ncbi:MAG: RluA family pseudouridine synthase [Thermoanaerobaculia bacterium]
MNPDHPAGWSFSFPGEAPERLDLALIRGPVELSRREARRRIDAGLVTINGRPVSVASRAVSPGDRLSILAPDFVVPIVANESGVVAVAKPSGIPTQPAAQQGPPAASEIVASMLRRERQPDELFIVHRLDTGTSGVLVFARSRAAAATLSRIFASENPKKVYLSIVHGAVEEPVEIDLPIARESASRFRADPAGRPAVTLIRPLGRSSGFSLIEATLRSGRTHQIRVHLASIGNPVAGDRKYGGGFRDNAVRPMLHAWLLELPSFGTYVAPVPDDFARFASAEELATFLPNAMQ